MSAHYLAQQLINALSHGSILALLAIGYTMIYGILGLINFAHGEIFMIGAFACFGAVDSPWLLVGCGFLLGCFYPAIHPLLSYSADADAFFDELGLYSLNAAHVRFVQSSWR